MTAKLSPTQMAWRAAQDIADGAYVNLGIGFPEMVAKFQPPGREAIFHTENGILGFGEAPSAGSEDWDLINAGKKAVTLKPGTAFFHTLTVSRWCAVAISMWRYWALMRWQRRAIWQIGPPARVACPQWGARWIWCMGPRPSR